MVGLMTKIGLPVVLLGAVLYPLFIKDLVFNLLGVGRVIQPLSDFPYNCRQIRDPNLQACEDMWFHEHSRQLFLACSDPMSRKEWMPNIGRLNASGRSLTDKVIAMNIDHARGLSYSYRILKTPNFSGVNSDGTIGLVGMTGESVTASIIRLWFVNTRPSLGPAGELLDNTKVGGNSTIEMFEMDRNANAMTHKQTFASPQIATPNNIAVTGDAGFYFTNDHGLNKVGLKFESTVLLGGADVSYCDHNGKCKHAASGFKFANGLLMGRDGLLYVPSASWGGITVFSINKGPHHRSDKSLTKVTQIPFPYPIDNLSQDQNGDIWIPHFPKMAPVLAMFDNPLGPTAPSAVSRMRKSADGEYVIEKILEDRDGEKLPGTTTVIHDAKTGRLFLSGVVSPFITVCEPR